MYQICCFFFSLSALTCIADIVNANICRDFILFFERNWNEKNLLSAPSVILWFLILFFFFFWFPTLLTGICFTSVVLLFWLWNKVVCVLKKCFIQDICLDNMLFNMWWCYFPLLVDFFGANSSLRFKFCCFFFLNAWPAHHVDVIIALVFFPVFGNTSPQFNQIMNLRGKARLLQVRKCCLKMVYTRLLQPTSCHQYHWFQKI